MAVGDVPLKETSFLKKGLEWALSGKGTFDDTFKALNTVQNTAGHLEEMADHMGNWKQTSVSDIFKEAGAKILTWGEQIRYIENKLKSIQQSIVEDQICRAIDSGDSGFLLKLHDQYGADFNRTMIFKGRGCTPLTYAIDMCQAKMVAFLLEKIEVNPNQSDQSHGLHPHGVTPLIMAIARGDERIVDLLLRYHVFVDLPSHDLLPISYAILLGRRNLALKLIASPNVNVNRWSLGGIGPLQAAIELNDLPLVELLKNYGADLNSCDGTKASPLTFALSKGKREIAEQLIRLGADPERADRLGRVPKQMGL